MVLFGISAPIVASAASIFIFERSITLVIDYCQNLDLPHLGGEQLGDTYYYSSVWIYCLGFVDTSEDKLYAYVYKELDAKKGGNNVASILLYHVISYVLDDFCCAPNIEVLNIVMDNCGGQNKKKHTKNACDRMFNMLKIKWHKSNVYSMAQAIEVLNAAENVTAIEAGHIHVDYASLFNRWYKQPASGSNQKNHIFSFCSDTIKNVFLTSKSSHIAAVTSTQSIKKFDKNVPDHVRKMDLLWAKVTFLPKPGLKPIKQVHLYTKWRSVVPHPFKDDLCPLPPNDIIRQR